jgi:hypothetical protein
MLVLLLLLVPVCLANNTQSTTSYGNILQADFG